MRRNIEFLPFLPSLTILSDSEDWELFHNNSLGNKTQQETYTMTNLPTWKTVKIENNFRTVGEVIKALEQVGVHFGSWEKNIEKAMGELIPQVRESEIVELVKVNMDDFLGAGPGHRRRSLHDVLAVGTRLGLVACPKEVIVPLALQNAGRWGETEHVLLATEAFQTQRMRLNYIYRMDRDGISADHLGADEDWTLCGTLPSDWIFARPSR